MSKKGTRVTPRTIRQIRERLGMSQREFGQVLWDAVHGLGRNGDYPYSRQYVGMLEHSAEIITPRIAQGIQAIAARLDGADEVQARAYPVDGLLVVNDLPAGTIILGRARRCANPGCPVVFVPTHPRQKYHSRSCAETGRKIRAKARRRKSGRKPKNRD
ncbi:MAG: hypothetical protein H8E35_00490 [Ardenticatenia bacterium]|nr:hypothetical protein [Ardenticatenia bacterium]